MVYLQRWVHETNDVCVESSIDGKQDGQFSERLNSAEKHRTNDNVADDLENAVNLTEHYRIDSKQRSITYQACRSTSG